MYSYNLPHIEYRIQIVFLSFIIIYLMRSRRWAVSTRYPYIFIIMTTLLEDLPVDLVGTNVLGYLSLKEIVMLERACGSKKSHQAFMEQIQYCEPVDLSDNKHSNILALNWFSKVQGRIKSLTVQLSGDNPGPHVKNIKVECLQIQIDSNITVESLNPLLESNMEYKVINITIERDQNNEVMEQLSVFTGNVRKLIIQCSNNCMDWLTVDMLSRWKPKEIEWFEDGSQTTKYFVSLIAQTCTELTSIKLDSDNINDAAVIAIPQYCSKLETLLLSSSNITWTSLVALSERGLPLKKLDIDYIRNIPTTDIARRCSHALSRIDRMYTLNFYQNGQDASIIIPYMTGLTSIELDYYSNTYVPLLIQHCHKLTNLNIYGGSRHVVDILSLGRVNPLLQEIRCYILCCVTDTALIELMHACPHLHTLYLPYETDITDISILALSEHCPQVQELDIRKCHNVTETAVLQLLQRCRKLTTLEVSSSSLSEETWTQLDKNTQKRLRRQK